MNCHSKIEIPFTLDFNLTMLSNQSLAEVIRIIPSVTQATC